MAFPLPADPESRRLVVLFWIDDIDDRLASHQVQDAEKSWKIAQDIYLNLPSGEGNEEIESALMLARVKLNKRSSKL